MHLEISLKTLTTTLRNYHDDLKMLHFREIYLRSLQYIQLKGLKTRGIILKQQLRYRYK